MKKVRFWILSFTWGLPMTLIGCIVFLVLMVFGFKPKKFGYTYYINIGKHWGGVELGAFFLTDSSDHYGIKCHEHGHCLQNLWMGPFFPFLVAIPSALRYWLFEIKTEKGKALYSLLVMTILLLITGALVILGRVFEITWLLIVGIVLFSYMALVGFWLIGRELPKFQDSTKPEPDYDEFWPEGNATRRGTELIRELEARKNEIKVHELTQKIKEDIKESKGPNDKNKPISF